MADVASVTVLVLLSTMQPIAGHAARQQATPFADAVRHPPALAQAPQAAQSKPPRDSLKNGAIIGLVVGGVAGLFAGAEGCVLGSGLSGDADESCTGPILAGALIFGAAGAGIGAGIDALFQRAASVPGMPHGTRRGVRLRLRF